MLSIISLIIQKTFPEGKVKSYGGKFYFDLVHHLDLNKTLDPYFTANDVLTYHDLYSVID